MFPVKFVKFLRTYFEEHPPTAAPLKLKIPSFGFFLFFTFLQSSFHANLVYKNIIKLHKKAKTKFELKDLDHWTKIRVTIPDSRTISKVS